MIISPLSIAGAAVVTFPVHTDERGSFYRLYCAKDLAGILQDMSVVQINNSYNVKKGTVRGFHFQYPPKKEMKLIRCLRGAVFDVIVDIRKGSPTFLKWEGVRISEENHRMIVVPPGCAHGFQTLADETELLYLHTDYYSPECDGGLSVSDPCIGVQWPVQMSVISERDENHPLLTPDFMGIDI